MIWAGVVAQLNRTRGKTLLKDAALPYPLYVMLRHFAHDPARLWSVTELTAAFETQQPGITKQVQKLFGLGLLDQIRDESDGRIRRYCINRQGQEVLMTVGEAFQADHAALFQDWSERELASLHQALHKLKSHLDDNRLTDK